MAQNDFLPFATGSLANVVDQASWAQDPTVSNGFFSGLAPSAKFNKAWRQAAFPSASVSEWVNQQLVTVPIPDDGNVQNWVDNFDAALARKISSLTRTRLSAHLDLYVAVGGNDNNDGLTPQTPWATGQKAWDFISGFIDLGGWTVTVNFAPGTYSGWTCTGTPVGATGYNVLFLGDMTQPDNVVINAQNACCVTAFLGSIVSVQGFKLQATGGPGNASAGVGLAAWSASIIYFDTVDFGNCGTAHVMVAGWASIGSFGPYTISGSSPCHYSTYYPAANINILGANVTVNNNPNFSQAFLSAGFMSGMNVAPPCVFTGPATGRTMLVDTNSTVFIGGQNPNSYFPGNLPATINTGNGAVVQ